MENQNHDADRTASKASGDKLLGNLSEPRRGLVYEADYPPIIFFFVGRDLGLVQVCFLFTHASFAAWFRNRRKM
ncbi:hypothetical protein U1Q18_037324 [Sarracenia purpurea var. burkii]